MSETKGAEVEEVVENLEPDEEEDVLEGGRLSARLVYEIIRRDGTEELERPTSSLIWAGLAAGIMISFSVVGESVFRAYLPDTKSRPLIENLGYSIGFVMVILGRLQLFTENTITTVIPLMRRPTLSNFRAVSRLWGIVLAANVVGTIVAAAFMAWAGAFPEEILTAAREIGLHMMENTPTEMFARAIPAGIIVASIVWMLPSSGGNAFWLIVAFTWLIAAGDFTHVVAGSTEAAYLVLTSGAGIGETIWGFFVPVLAGNVVGGTMVFAMLAHGQVRGEMA